MYALHACVHVGLCVHTCECACGDPQLTSGIFLSGCLPYSLTPTPELTDVASLASQLTPISVFQTLKRQEGPQIYVGSGIRTLVLRVS